MNGAKHPLLVAYEMDALHPLLTQYIRWLVKAVTVEAEYKAAEYARLAEGAERHISKAQVGLGRALADLLIAGSNDADPS